MPTEIGIKIMNTTVNKYKERTSMYASVRMYVCDYTQ